MEDFQFFWAEGEGGGASGDSSLVTDAGAIASKAAPVDDNAELLKDITEQVRKPAAAAADDAKAKTPERGEDGKFKPADGKAGEDGEGAQDKNAGDDDQPTEAQKALKAWQDELAAEAKKAQEPPASKTDDLTKDKTDDSKASADADQPKTGDGTAKKSGESTDFEPFASLGDEAIKDPNDGEVLQDLVPMRDAYNKLAEGANKAIATLLDQVKQQGEQLARLAPAIEHLARAEVAKTRDSIMATADKAAGILEGRFDLKKYGLPIDARQVTLAAQAALPFYIQMGRVSEGNLPDAATMCDMWEQVNRSRLEAAGVKPKADGKSGADSEGSKEEAAKKAPPLPKGGADAPGGPKEPASDEEAIIRDLKAARKNHPG